MKLVSLLTIILCSFLHAEARDEIIQIVTDYVYPSEKFEGQQIISGVGNDVYLVSNDLHCCIGKVFKKKSIQEVIQIDEGVSYLQSFGIRIPQIISLNQLQNGMPVQISQFAKGRHISDADLNKAALLMAKLHLIPSSLVFKKRYKTDEHYRALFVKCSSWEYTKDLQEIYQNLDLSYLDYLPQGIVHGDFSYTNLLKDEDDELILLDFDHLGHSYLLTDIVRCQMFYGFDNQGQVDLFKIENFVRNYSSLRKLSPVEADNFYTHMKLMMMDTALEMYYRMYVKGDLAEARVLNADNSTLMPDLLVTKIKNLSQLKSIDVSSNFPIVFFGLSGVGKTTLIHRIATDCSDRFYIPIFTCTRAPRADDNPTHFEYVTYEEFQKLVEDGEFALTMCEDERCYGYRKDQLVGCSKSPLLNCSIYGMADAQKLGGVLVLIEGEANCGLKSRNDKEITSSRIEVNKRIIDRFLSDTNILEQFDIRHWNEWDNLDGSVNTLLKSIFEKLDEHNYKQEKAAA